VRRTQKTGPSRYLSGRQVCKWPRGRHRQGRSIGSLKKKKKWPAELASGRHAGKLHRSGGEDQRRSPGLLPLLGHAPPDPAPQFHGSLAWFDLQTEQLDVSPANHWRHTRSTRRMNAPSSYPCC